jgi:nitrate/TMAO reductase-like tetraheme cytochrome c subunit
VAAGLFAIGSCTGAFGDQPFPDAGAYWAPPVEVEGDAAQHHPTTRDLSARACALCHPRQYEEWRGSLHAQAVSPGLLGQLGALSLREQRGCLACHVPAAEQQATWEARALEASAELHGVDCASCHVRGQQRFGPRARPATPHGPVAAQEFFRSSAFCAPCHQFGADGVAVNGKPLENTYAEWRGSRQAQEGKTCQTCHMPGGSHRFAGIHDPAMTAGGLRVTAVRAPDGVEVEVGNEGAGHALPTYPVPRIQVRVNAADGAGGTGLEHAIQRRMDWDAERGWRELADTRLMPGQSVTLAHPLPAAAAAEVTVEVEPDADYFDRVYPALLEALAGEASPEALELLQEARRRAGESPYVLMRMSCGTWSGQTAACVSAGPSAGVPGRSGAVTDARAPTPGPRLAQALASRAGGPQGGPYEHQGPGPDRGARPRAHY